MLTTTDLEQTVASSKFKQPFKPEIIHPNRSESTEVFCELCV